MGDGAIDKEKRMEARKNGGAFIDNLDRREFRDGRQTSCVVEGYLRVEFSRTEGIGGMSKG
jgi:hypothetical protein